MIDAEPIWAESDVIGSYFKVFATAKYRPGRTFHADPASVVRSEVAKVCRAVCGDFAIDEPQAAADVINARLGVPAHCSRGYYRDLVANVVLVADETSRQAAGAMRAARARVERLQFLKRTLYADPALMMIAWSDNHPDEMAGVDRLQHFQKLADQLRLHEQWWSPIMAAWNQLVAETSSPAGVENSMRVLVNAIRRLDNQIAEQNRLADIADRDAGK